VTLLMDSKVGHYWPPFTSVGHSQKISDWWRSESSEFCPGQPKD
jgi:hypothetical protein